MSLYSQGDQSREVTPLEMMRPERTRSSTEGRVVAAVRVDVGMTGGTAAAPGPHMLVHQLADAALRRAARPVQSEDRVDDGVRELIRQACIIARDRGLRAEQVLLLLKELWRGLPEGLRLPRHEAGDVIARAVTVCIDEYYRPDRGRS